MVPNSLSSPLGQWPTLRAMDPLDGFKLRRRPGHIAIAALLAVLAASGLAGIRPVGAATTTTVTVNAATAVGPNRATLSTQVTYHGVIESLPNAQTRLNALKMPMIRVHAGSDATYAGFGPQLPAGLTKGSWSFAELDTLVTNARDAGAVPVMNIRYAPNWMWTCQKAFDGGAAGVGALADPTYNTFGDYMARLVSYYNKGSMVTENGTTITNPRGTSHRIDIWELWNEPDLSNEVPCHRASWGPALSAQEYTKMWNVVAPKMRTSEGWPERGADLRRTQVKPKRWEQMIGRHPLARST